MRSSARTVLSFGQRGGGVSRLHPSCTRRAAFPLCMCSLDIIDVEDRQVKLTQPRRVGQSVDFDDVAADREAHQQEPLSRGSDDSRSPVHKHRPGEPVQDGEELDIPSDIELAGLSEEDFRIAYVALTKTQAKLLKPNSEASRILLRSIVDFGKIPVTSLSESTMRSGSPLALCYVSG